MFYEAHIYRHFVSKYSLKLGLHVLSTPKLNLPTKWIKAVRKLFSISRISLKTNLFPLSNTNK